MLLLAMLHGLLWGLHLVSTVFLLLFCLNGYLMIVLHDRARHRMLQRDAAVWQTWHADAPRWPGVTVQVPVYNEPYVIQRLIDAVGRLDYPPDRLQIQILDDSTDETTALATRLVRRYRHAGVDITLLHRSHRGGYKAGALQEGLAQATGEFIAIFDADFVPAPDFLRHTVPFLADPTIAAVQTRWDYLNRDYSILTAAYASGLDGHFGVEQAARCWSGLFMHFNGSGGVWRRCAIDDAGGWHADTLTEDLDLSYRAQLRGWRLKFLPHVVCPSEIPAQMSAIKSQQHRWTKGAMQTAKKLVPALLRARLPLFTKYQALCHLTTPLVHPLLLLAVLMAPWSAWFGGLFTAGEPLFGARAFSLAALGPFSMYVYAQTLLSHDWPRRLSALPFLLLFGIGMALNNTKAIAEALCNVPSTFVRTPKFRLETPSDTWIDKRSRFPFPWLSLSELLLAGYCAAGLLLAWQHDRSPFDPYLLLYTVGFASVALMSLCEYGRKRRLVRRQKSSDDRGAL
jgi:cellulose synthase/poly-beta-1,6-N-acetylglucosamine synthase-like glycosyltransferase